MATMTLSVPNDLKEKMEKANWINWSSVARRAFAETLKDYGALETMKKIRAISEISDSDKREVRFEIAGETIKSIENSARKIKSGKLKSMAMDEFNAWCNSI